MNLILPRVVPVTRRGELLLDSNSSVVTIVFIAICLSAAPRTPPQEIESTLLHTSAVLSKKRFPFIIISHHPY